MADEYMPADERRAATVDAVVDLAAVQSPSTITTAAIARRMNLTQGALFRHFANKGAIWEAAMDWIADRLLERIENAAARAPTPLAALEAMFMAHIDFICAHPGVPRLIFHQLEQPGATAAKRVAHGMLQAYGKRVTRLLEAGKADGQLDARIDVTAARVLFVGAIQGLVVQSLLASKAPKRAREGTRCLRRVPTRNRDPVMKNPIKSALVLPVVVLIAVAVVVFVVKSRPPIDHETMQYPTRSVQAITARTIPFRSRAVAYGNVEPAVLLESRAEVTGKVSYIHPALAKGGSLAGGTVALRIEPTTFELSRDQSKAALAGTESALSQLQVEQRTTRTSLSIAKENLEISEDELARALDMFEHDAISRSAVDAEEQRVLQLRQQIADLEGKLAGYKSRKAASKAQIEQSKSQLALSEDTLGRTEIRLPFDARIGGVFVEEGELATVGSVLFEALGTEAVEIEAQLPTRRLRPLLVGGTGTRTRLDSSTALQTAIANMKLEARVALVGVEGTTGSWEGRLTRLSESIDPTRDTIGLVVTVNDPYGDVVPGERPPLIRGMYARVELLAPVRDRIVVPRRALHQGRVYIAKPNEDGYTLEIRPVRIAEKQGSLVVIDEGVAEDELVITTDVVPVLDGLSLDLIASPEAEERLALEALGQQEPSR